MHPLDECTQVWISVVPLVTCATYLANKVRHVLDVSDLPRLTIIQARVANLISLHAVLNLKVNGIEQRNKYGLSRKM